MFIHFEDREVRSGLDIDKIAAWGYDAELQVLSLRFGDGDSSTYYNYKAEAIYRLLLAKSAMICEEKK